MSNEVIQAKFRVSLACALTNDPLPFASFTYQASGHGFVTHYTIVCATHGIL